MPALDPMSERAYDFQYNFIKSEEAVVVLDMLTKGKFRMKNIDESTKRSAYLTILKLCKLLLTIVGNVMANVMDDAKQPVANPENHEAHANNRSLVAMLKQALLSVPNHSTEYMLRSVAAKLAQHLSIQILTGKTESDGCRLLFVHRQAFSWGLPDTNTILSIIKVAWAASTGNLSNVDESVDVIHMMHEANQTNQRNLDPNDVLVCKEALEVLTIALLLNPNALVTLTRDKMWRTFLIDLVLLSTSKAVRIAASEQFLLISTWCSTGHQAIQQSISLLMSVLHTTVVENAKQCHEYFQVRFLCELYFKEISLKIVQSHRILLIDVIS